MIEFSISFSKPQSKCGFVIGENAISTLRDNLSECAPQSAFVITDANVFRLHKRTLTKLIKGKNSSSRLLVLPAGERVKSYKYQIKIHQWLLENGADRKSCVVGVGGGVVCDTAGFAAATFMRGVSCILVPTTLLAQIDAAIGGKNGINLSSAKNIVGTIRQPSAVIADTLFLNTLKPVHFKEGLSELLKMALIGSRMLRKQYEVYENADIEERRKLIQMLITEAIKAKLAVVRKDQFESGLRKILNFGHTTAHALETLSKYRRISHGKAVAFGMLVAIELSRTKPGLDEDSVKWANGRIRHLYRSFNLPNVGMDEFWNAVMRDKKRLENKVQFVLLETLGSPIIETVTKRDFVRAYQRAASEWSSQS